MVQTETSVLARPRGYQYRSARGSTPATGLNFGINLHACSHCSLTIQLARPSLSAGARLQFSHNVLFCSQGGLEESSVRLGLTATHSDNHQTFPLPYFGNWGYPWFVCSLNAFNQKKKSKTNVKMCSCLVGLSEWIIAFLLPPSAVPLPGRTDSRIRATHELPA